MAQHPPYKEGQYNSSDKGSIAAITPADGASQKTPAASRKRKLGHSNVSPIGLGCMGMSEHYGETDDKQSLATLMRAFEIGVEHFDTANVYGRGHNEMLLQQFLKKLGRSRAQDIFLASKFGIVRSAIDADTRVLNGRPEYARLACEATLQRLGVEAISLYYLHRIDPQVPVEETVAGMAKLVKEGKIQGIGLSEVSAETLKRAHSVHPISAVQSEYSLWTRDPEVSILTACRELGVAFVAYSPLGRGFLTANIRETGSLDTSDFRHTSPRFQKENFNSNLRVADAIASFAKTLGYNAAQLSLAWVLAQGDFIHAIPGTKRQKYLEDNVKSLNLELSQSQLQELDTILNEIGVAGERYSSGGMRTLNR